MKKTYFALKSLWFRELDSGKKDKNRVRQKNASINFSYFSVGANQAHSAFKIRRNLYACSINSNW